MRILHVTEASGGGTFAIVRTLAAGLVRSGHEVILAFGRRPETPEDPGAGLPAEVELVELPWAARSLRAQVPAARALRRLVRAREPDLVHLHSSFAGALGAAWIAGRAPCVYTPHGYAFGREGVTPLRGAAYRWVEWCIARRCALVGAVSETEADLARTALRAPRVAVVPNGIADLDPGRLPPRAAPERPLVVALGRIDSQRRPAAAARILGAVARNADVRWIGGAAAGEDAPLHAAAIPLTGWLAHDDALAELGRASVCLHWSGSDALPVAVLEALARDVVVVASDIPANREVLGPGQVCADEAGAIALVESVLRDGAVRDRLLGEQRSRRSRWSADQMLTGWMAAYERALASDPARARTIDGS